MAQYLRNQIDGYLPPFGNNEGQMVPEVRPMMRKRPWKVDAQMDWMQIKRCWNTLLLESGKSTFVEKSPPNLVRVGEIRKAFAGEASYLFSISNPYSQICSCIYNYSEPPLKIAKLVSYTNEWITRARMMAENVSTFGDIPLVTYEKFCSNPRILNEQLGVPVITMGDIPGKQNEPIQQIVDLTRRNILFVDAFAIDRISEILAKEIDLLREFGYELIDGQTFVNDASNDMASLHAGLIRRAQWEASRKRPAKKGRNRPAKGRSRPAKGRRSQSKLKKI